MITKITADKFYKDVVKSKDISIVVFSQCWSGSSLLIEKHLKKLSNSYSGLISVYRINAENNKEIVNEFSLYRFPTTLFFKDGELVDMLTGLFSMKILDDVANNIVQKK